jgi:hypothetical protein
LLIDDDDDHQSRFGIKVLARIATSVQAMGKKLAHPETAAYPAQKF